MAKCRDKVFFVSKTRLLYDGCTRRLQPRDRIYLVSLPKRRWIVVEQPMNMDGFLVVEETSQGEWIAATIAFLRWLIRVYEWIVFRGFRTYCWMYGKIPKPDPFGIFRLPFTPFWTAGAGEHPWLDHVPPPNIVDNVFTATPLFPTLIGGEMAEQRQPAAPTGAILNGGDQIRWPWIYGDPRLVAEWDPAAAQLGCAAPGSIVRMRADNAIEYIPAPPSAAQRDPA